MSILVIVSYVLFSWIKISFSYDKEDNPIKNSAKIACVTFFQPKVKIYKSELFIVFFKYFCVHFTQLYMSIYLVQKLSYSLNLCNNRLFYFQVHP